MRVTTAFHRLLGLQDITVRGVSFPDADSDAHTVVVEVGLRRKRLACPLCGFSTRARYDTRPVSPDVAASGLRALAGAAARWAAPGVLPDPRGAGGGGALRPSRDRVQPRLRGPRRL